MSSEKAGRRLSAILAADVVGYRHLVEGDEKATFAAMQMLRSTVIDPLLCEHKGTIGKVEEDEILVLFGSAADAARCAARIQEGLKHQQKDVAPERQIILRIGIDLGEAAAKGDSLKGGGVELATQLMRLCEPGGVLISAAAEETLPGRQQVLIEDAGARQVEDSPEPVHAYRVRMAQSLEHAPRRRNNIHPLSLAALAVLILGGAYLVAQARMPASPVAEREDTARQEVAKQKDPPPEKTKDDTDPNIWGNIEGLGSDGSIRGWVADVRDPSDQLTVYLYISGRDPTGRLPGFSDCIETTGGEQDKVCGEFTFLGRTVAKQSYDVPSDVPARAQTGEHGFLYAVPTQFRDGTERFFYAFVIPRGHENEAEALLRGETPDKPNLIYLYGSPQKGSVKS